METSHLLIAFLILCSGGAVLSLILPERRNPAALAWVASLSSLVILLASGKILLSGQVFQAELWRIGSLGVITLKIDRLSALFIFITGIVFLPVSLYSARYLEKYLGRYSLKSFAAFYHLLFASIVLIFVSADVLSFILSWEIMSILAYLLVNYEHDKKDNTRSGLLMLAMSEAGALAVVLGFLILARVSGHLDFASLKSAAAVIGNPARLAVFLLIFFGFSVKAGLIPVNSWLPRAHTAAPGNFSAILSGATLNLGIYGIIRVNADILHQTSVGAGIIVLIIGSLSALLGILYATTENDMKRMLAHSSIENMGIVAVGLGAGFIFSSLGHPALAGIAFIAALYHMTNHSLFKTLLFLGAGGIDSGTGTRNMDRLGGLIRSMPWTGLFFLVGALSIAALPPFNGFVSEWLTLQTLLRSVTLQSAPVKIVFALSGAALALTAGLAVTCFVKAFAMSFLGMTRSEAARKAVELSWSMKVPMAFLASLCLIAGILPTYIIPVLDRTVTPLVHESVVNELVPPFFTAGKGTTPKFNQDFISEFHSLGAQVGKDILPGRGLVVLHRGGKRNPIVYAMSTSYTIVVLLFLLGGTFVLVRVFTRRRKVRREPAWNGGLRRLLPGMTYTATGFSNPVRVIFDGIFHPTVVEETKSAVEEHFRVAIEKERLETHVVERLILQPLVRMLRDAAGLIGSMHVGSVNVYAMYVLIGLVLLLIIGQVF